MQEARHLQNVRQILAQHKNELRERFHVRSIAIFGSCARGEQKPGSDIDILVDFTCAVGWEVVDLRDYLEQILGAKVDLVTAGALMRKPALWEAVQEDLVYV